MPGGERPGRFLLNHRRRWWWVTRRRSQTKIYLSVFRKQERKWNFWYNSRWDPSKTDFLFYHFWCFFLKIIMYCNRKMTMIRIRIRFSLIEGWRVGMTGEEHWFTHLLRVLSGFKRLLFFFVIVRMLWWWQWICWNKWCNMIMILMMIIIVIW